MVSYENDIKKILFSAEEIQARVQELGAKITSDYQGKKLVVIGLLEGAAWFVTDLTRSVNLPMRIDFMVASSYGNGTETSGAVKVKLDVTEDLRGKDVLVVDDIIDSGVTFAAIVKILGTHGCNSIKTCALCDKAERRVNGFECDYVGFHIPDEFIVGYGLDYAGDYRNLPFIGVLRSRVYARAK